MLNDTVSLSSSNSLQFFLNKHTNSFPVVTRSELFVGLIFFRGDGLSLYGLVLQ